MKALVQTLPAVTVRAKDLCQGKMKVQKSFVHQGKTLEHGSFNVRETVWECAAGCRRPSGVKVTKRAETVVDSLLPRRTVGYDVMVFVGLQRFLHYKQREEIQAALLERGIDISTGEVSELSQKFICYLARLHRARAAEIKAALDADGGWPLHVDATGEAGRGTMLCVIAGWREWVLGSWKISTERADLILQHIDTHGDNLWGHAIHLPARAGGGIRLVSRTNFLAENFFGRLKHDERRRSGQKNLGNVLEHMPAEAALVRNLLHDDYVTAICGSLDDLPTAFAELDRLERAAQLNATPMQRREEKYEDDLDTVLQMASASLSSVDRRVIRSEEMDRRIAAAAGSRAPRYRC